MLNRKDLLYLIYNTLLPLGLAASSPFIAYKITNDRRWRLGVKERIGVLPDSKLPREERQPKIWVHAASVGEVNTVMPFGEKIRQKWPEAEVILSTTTAAGQETAKNRVRWADLTIYLPLDFKPITNAVVEKIKPDLFILCETEIWPNLLRSLKKAGSYIALINGRISERSYPRYKLATPALRRVLDYVDCFAMQSRADALKMIAIGAPAGRVHVTGNFKFDSSTFSLKEKKALFSRENLGLNDSLPLLVAGSTHRPEEELIISLFRRLKREIGELQLIIAPRHPQRFPEVAQILRKSGIPFARRSLANLAKKEHIDILLLDTLGELGQAYQLADLVFIGGSFAPIGGHNLLEAAAGGKPVITGPHMNNFKDILNLLTEEAAAFQALDKEVLFDISRNLLIDEKYRSEVGNRAKMVIYKNRGAVSRTMELLWDRLKEDERFYSALQGELT